LQDCAKENAIYRRDLARLKKLDLACAPLSPAGKSGAKCC